MLSMTMHAFNMQQQSQQQLSQSSEEITTIFVIGFAKFRTRSEAVKARDVLNGRRIDVDRGAILKAEIAKRISKTATKRQPSLLDTAMFAAFGPSLSIKGPLLSADALGSLAIHDLPLSTSQNNSNGSNLASNGLMSISEANASRLILDCFPAMATPSSFPIDVPCDYNDAFDHAPATSSSLFGTSASSAFIGERGFNSALYNSDSLLTGRFQNFHLEEELRRYLLFNQVLSVFVSHRANGPMCFVEFESVDYATAALFQLYGNHLSNSAKAAFVLATPKTRSVVRLESLNHTLQQNAYLDAIPTYKIGRKVNPRILAEPTNGIFDAKVLSRVHAEILFENSTVYIRDLKSSNEFGIDIVDDDGVTQFQSTQNQHDQQDQHARFVSAKVVAEAHTILDNEIHSGFQCGQCFKTHSQKDIAISKSMALSSEHIPSQLSPEYIKQVDDIATKHDTCCQSIETRCDTKLHDAKLTKVQESVAEISQRSFTTSTSVDTLVAALAEADTPDATVSDAAAALTACIKTPV
ncbi:hypothetical protein BSLG_005924 [Batrachochytrium salamandrivorans]|nr:hypothetical protein BSLG_005924 [Batrachochytrium salamandrivorans]